LSGFLSDPCITDRPIDRVSLIDTHFVRGALRWLRVCDENGFPLWCDNEELREVNFAEMSREVVNVPIIGKYDEVDPLLLEFSSESCQSGPAPLQGEHTCFASTLALQRFVFDYTVW
jgi:hypothetical protein